MGRDSELLRLERHIEQLLQRFSALQTEKQRLEGALQKATDDNRQLREQLDSLHNERGDIRTRVSSLIERIERWEAEEAVQVPDVFADEDPDTELDTVTENEEPGEDASELSATRKQERDGGIQGNLFTR